MSLQLPGRPSHGDGDRAEGWKLHRLEREGGQVLATIQPLARLIHRAQDSKFHVNTQANLIRPNRWSMSPPHLCSQYRVGQMVGTASRPLKHGNDGLEQRSTFFRQGVLSLGRPAFFDFVRLALSFVTLSSVCQRLWADSR